MAIKGLTDRQKILLPRLAKIRLGVRDNERSYPKDVDYFVLPPDYPEIAKVYGAKPKALVAMFAADDEEINFATRAEAWKASKNKIPGTNKPRSILFCSSDGETANRIYRPDRDEMGKVVVSQMEPSARPEPGDMFQMPCPLEECPYYEKRECKPTGRLNFFLPQVTWRGLFQIETSSLYAFGNIKQFFNLMNFMNKGRVAGVPFELSRRPMAMTVDGKSVVKHVIHLEVLEKPPKMLPPPFMAEERQIQPVEADQPAELFPPEVTGEEPKALPAPEKDPLEDLVKFVGLTDAQYEKLKLKCKGDIGKMQAWLEQKAKDKDIDDVFSDPKPAPDDDSGQSMMEF